MEREGGTAEKDGTRDSTGVLAEVTVPENVQEGGEHRQPAGEPGKTGRGFAIAPVEPGLTRRGHGPRRMGGADGTGVSTEVTKDISYPKDAASKDQT